MLFPPAPKKDFLLAGELHSMKQMSTSLKIESSLQGFTEALSPEQNELKRID